MTRTISHAVMMLKPEVKEAIKRAFAATNAMDLYDGKLDVYLQIIAQTLERKNIRIEELELRIEKVKKLVSSV